MPLMTKTDFSEYCLRKLGKPVISINVAPEQVSDRVDEAIQVWKEKHFDATEKEWVAYALTADDLGRGYITLPADIHQVDEMIPMSTIFKENGTDSLFSYRYQYFVTNMSPFQPMDMLNYYMTMTNINEVNDMVNTTERFEFTKHKNKLMIYRGFEGMTEGSIMCFHVYKSIDPETDPGAWEDKWLKQYATALIKQQWGSNMKKHGEIQLLGGITVNGQQIFDEAVLEIQQLEEQLQENYMEPVSFSMG
jgi:hypothetical protein